MSIEGLMKNPIQSAMELVDPMKQKAQMVCVLQTNSKTEQQQSIFN